MKSTKELRDFLVEQMEGLAAGSVADSQARSVANLAQQIYNTLNAEAKFAALRAKGLGDEIKPVEF